MWIFSGGEPMKLFAIILVSILLLTFVISGCSGTTTLDTPSSSNTGLPAVTETLPNPAASIPAEMSIDKVILAESFTGDW
jgi:hypothetical protein